MRIFKILFIILLEWLYLDCERCMFVLSISNSQLQLSLESHNVRPSGSVSFILSSHRIAFILYILLFGMVLSVLEKKKFSAPPPSPQNGPFCPKKGLKRVFSWCSPQGCPFDLIIPFLHLCKVKMYISRQFFHFLNIFIFRARAGPQSRAQSQKWRFDDTVESLHGVARLT